MRLSSIVVMAVAASPLVAQARDVCPSGPGAAFGITSLQCANCGFKQDVRPLYSFFAEPVVVEADGKTGINAGDVVEAVNGQPITTRAGAEAFTYPATGSNSITIRRGRDRQVVRVSVSAACGSKNRLRLSLGEIESVEVIKGPAAVSRFGPEAAEAGVVIIRTKPGQPLLTDSNHVQVRDEFLAALRRQRRGSEPLLVIDGVVMGRTLPAPTPISIRGRLGGVEPGPDSIIVIDDVVMSRTAREATPPVGRFGFAFTCEPRCTASTGRDGLLTYTYYRYRDFPPITAIAPGSAAERAGLRVGDLVVNVEGHSVLDDEGAKGLARLDRVDVLHLTVRRDGKEIDYTLKVSDKLD